MVQKACREIDLRSDFHDIKCNILNLRPAPRYLYEVREELDAVQEYWLGGGDSNG